MITKHRTCSEDAPLDTASGLAPQGTQDQTEPLSAPQAAGAFLRRMQLLAGERQGGLKTLAEQSDAESAFVVLNPAPHAPNRYISGYDAQGRKYLLAAPEELVRAHKELLEHAQACLGQALTRIGAGMVYFQPDGRVYVCGLSPTFQHRDHEYAHDRLTELLAGEGGLTQ